MLTYCSYMYRRFPSSEKSLQKDTLGLIIWFLYSAIIFGFVGQFSPILGFPAALFLYAVSIAGSAVFFYIYAVYEEDENNRKWDVNWEKV
ncbi:hypothetical protein RND71_011065 [Anisodus tanguticus]|uniref:Uncharacterized protein n=1 Tax=Anisodus tanguticus TaxID=243964 RepID=A0AAE1VT77_9SOLA|nr:hypothetical protein RND71_011065 [Anisodus tanguticus]